MNDTCIIQSRNSARANQKYFESLISPLSSMVTQMTGEMNKKGTPVRDKPIIAGTKFSRLTVIGSGSEDA